MRSFAEVPGVVTTPIQTYSHPEFNNEISLVGMTHLAEPSYYETVQKILDNQDAAGTVIHYERLQEPTTEQRQNLTPRQIAKMRLLGAIMSEIYSWGETSDFVQQLDHLQYRDHWENHDANRLDLLDHMNGPRLFLQYLTIQAIGVAISRVEPHQRRKMIQEGLAEARQKPANNPAPTSRKDRLTDILTGFDDYAVLDYRNEIALDAFDDQQAVFPGSDVSLVWGVDHLPGLGAGLVERGYQKVDETSLIAIRPR